MVTLPGSPRRPAYFIFWMIGLFALAPAAHRTIDTNKFVPVTMRFPTRGSHETRFASSATPRSGPQLFLPGTLGPRHPILPVPPLRARSRLRMSLDARSIEWMPALDPSSKLSPSSSEGRILPVFLLGNKIGSDFFLPGTEVVLNIIEPRYVSMYNEILLDGSRSFAIFARDPDDKNQLAAVGVNLYLTDLKKVSRETGGIVKYKCVHNVTGRVRLHGVLNPADATSEETYLKAEVSDLVDVDDDVNTAALESAAVSALNKMANLQEENEENIRFNKAMVERLHAVRGLQSGSLWSMAELWKDLLNVRTLEIAKESQVQVTGRVFVDPGKLLNTWIAGNGKLTVAPGVSEAMRVEAQLLSRRLTEEIEPLVVEKSRGMQLMIQTDRHADRLQIFTELIENEAKRVRARATLKTVLRSGQVP